MSALNPLGLNVERTVGLHRNDMPMFFESFKGMIDQPTVPTPARGQRWHSTAFAPDDPDGRVDVLGVIQTEHHGLVVVEHLVRGGDHLSAVCIEDFLQRRRFSP